MHRATEIKFTPGPWKACANPMRADLLFVCRDLPPEPTGARLLDGSMRYGLPPTIFPNAIGHADAHLIATAPDLYIEAEQSAVEHEEAANILQGVGHPRLADIFRKAAERARSITKKARGEA